MLLYHSQGLLSTSTGLRHAPLCLSTQRTIVQCCSTKAAGRQAGSPPAARSSGWMCGVWKVGPAAYSSVLLFHTSPSCSCLLPAAQFLGIPR